jgi:pimeloyl-ACP methyl ester carboxylesterase
VAPITCATPPTPAPISDPAPAEPQFRLPPRLARMIGRDDAVAGLCTQLLSQRFVNIVGLSLGELMPVITINPPAIEDVARIRARPAGLLGRLGIRRTNLLGASLGGYLARNFVLLHSDNVAQLVIANGFIDVVAFTITLPPASTGAAMDAAGIVQQTLRALFFVPTRSEGDVRLKRAVKALFGLAQILENYKSHVLLIMVGSHQRISNPG